MNEPALPVAIDVTDPELASELTRHVESHLGWQPVEDSPDLPARLRLTDRPSGAAGAVVILRSPDVSDVRRAVEGGAVDVIAWPAEADRLGEVVPRPRRPLDAAVLAVRGSAGGVGTSTVALAVAALQAWAGRRTWLVADDRARRLAGIHGDAGVIECESVPELRMARYLRDLAGRTAAGDLVVVDVGVAPRGQVLVARPDGDLPRALAGGGSAVVVTVGAGALRRDEIARVTAGRRHVHLPWDVRVARAGLRGVLPGAFPGRLLADLTATLGPPGAAAA